jgi:hypothetical protein
MRLRTYAEDHEVEEDEGDVQHNGDDALEAADHRLGVLQLHRKIAALPAGASSIPSADVKEAALEEERAGIAACLLGGKGLCYAADLSLRGDQYCCTCMHGDAAHLT